MTRNLRAFGRFFVAAALSIGVAHAQFTDGNILTAAQLNSALAAPTITGGSINGAPIGATTPSTGAFTSLSTTGAATIGGNLSAALLGTPGYTVATLPTGVKGAQTYVTDATSCTSATAVVGGGTTFCAVTYTGAAWVATGAPPSTSAFVAVGATAGGALAGTYPNPTLAATGVTAGTYASPSSVTVNAAGQVTSIAAGSGSAASGTTTIVTLGAGTSGNWTVPANVTYLHVTMVGGGGGKTASGNYGGGAGAYIHAIIPVTPGALLAYSVGSGGAAGSSGGATTFDGYSAGGGAAGGATAGGAGGTAAAGSTGTYFAIPGGGGSNDPANSYALGGTNPLGMTGWTTGAGAGYGYGGNVYSSGGPGVIIIEY